MFSSVRIPEEERTKEMSQEKQLILPESRRDLADFCSSLPPDDGLLYSQGCICQSSGSFQFRTNASSPEVVCVMTEQSDENSLPCAESASHDVSGTLAPDAAP